MSNVELSNFFQTPSSSDSGSGHNDYGLTNALFSHYELEEHWLKPVLLRRFLYHLNYAATLLRSSQKLSESTQRLAKYVRRNLVHRSLHDHVLRSLLAVLTQFPAKYYPIQLCPYWSKEFPCAPLPRTEQVGALHGFRMQGNAKLDIADVSVFWKKWRSRLMWGYCGFFSLAILVFIVTMTALKVASRDASGVPKSGWLL